MSNHGATGGLRRTYTYIRIISIGIILIPALLFYLSISGRVQRMLISNSAFEHAVGVSSIFVVYCCKVGFNTLTILIDTTILGILLYYYHKVPKRQLKIMLMVTVPLAIIVSSVFIYQYLYALPSIKLHEIYYTIAGFVFKATFTQVAILMMLPIALKMLKSQLLNDLTLRFMLIIAYVNALVVAYMVDTATAFINTLLLTNPSVVGGAGPVDGLVLYPLIPLLTFTIIWPLIELMQVRKRN